MTRTRRPLLAALLTALVLGLLPLPAAADGGAPKPSAWPTVSYREQGCTEIGYERGGLESAVRPLVPARFALVDFPGLPEGAPARVRLAVNEVTCTRGRFPGDDGPRRYTYLIVSAFVTATEGDQRDGSYVLFYATENRAQRATLRRAGWPVSSLGKRSAATVTRDTSGTPVGLALHVVGGGWNHDIAAVANAPQPAVATSTYEFYRDTAAGPSTACFLNRISQTSAWYSGDLRGTPFATVAYAPPVFTSYPGGLTVGEWDVTVTSGPCPESTAPARRVAAPRAADASEGALGEDALEGGRGRG